MLPHRPKLSHILREQQSLLHYIGHIAGHPSLEVPDGGIGEQRSPIQNWGGGLGRRCDLGISPLFNAFLRHFGLLGHSLGLIFLGGVGFPSFHYLLTLLLPFSFKVGRFKTKGLNRWRGGKLSLGCLPKTVSPQLGLQQFLQGRPWLSLDPYLVWYWCERVAEVIG